MYYDIYIYTGHWENGDITSNNKQLLGISSRVYDRDIMRIQATEIRRFVSHNNGNILT